MDTRHKFTKWLRTYKPAYILVTTEEELETLYTAFTLSGKTWNTGDHYFGKREPRTLPMLYSNEGMRRSDVSAGIDEGNFIVFKDIEWDIFDKFKDYNWLTYSNKKYYVTEVEPSESIKGNLTKVPAGTKIKQINKGLRFDKTVENMKIKITEKGNYLWRYQDGGALH